MKASYRPSFIRDLRRIGRSREFQRIHDLAFEEMPAWETLTGHSQIKCLSTREGAHRIRVGDYRIGFYYGAGGLVFARVLHRREIYRYFP